MRGKVAAVAYAGLLWPALAVSFPSETVEPCG